MNLVTIEHLTKSYTERLLFDDTAFSLNEGDKVGLIGINGTGKSTLLKIVAGLEEPDGGKVTRSRNLHIRYLPQTPIFDDGDTVLESVLKANQNENQLWDLESQAKSMLNRLGVGDFDKKTKLLSGGQRKRVALASVLLSKADLLILDEPTNHLDSYMADWLEGYLKDFKGSILMITHDRYFLDSVTNRIVELDKGKLYNYQAGYEGFLELKAERMDMALASERKRQSILRVELEWIRRGARARSTKQKGHIQRYEALRDQKGPEFDKEVELDSVYSRLGRTTVELENISKAYGDRKLIQDFTYIFLKNDRVGIIGPNGAGKSTLMKMIAGWETPDSGTVSIGHTVKLGYFSQENEAMDETLKVIDYIKNAAEYVQTKDGSISASQMLERFLFPSSVQYTTISKLSGGEKRRLYLLRILMEAPNVLLLDEPTNDLDIRTLTILEDYLDSFSGIVAAVSHDRYFLDRVVNRVFAFEGDGKIVQYEGGFTDYQAALERKDKAAGALDGADKTAGGKNAKGVEVTGGKAAKSGEVSAANGTSGEASGPAANGSKKNSWKSPEKKLKFSYKEQKEWDTIEEDIETLESQIAELDVEIEGAASDYTRLNQLMKDKAEKETLLEQKMERWIYLNDLAERIASQG